MLRWIIRTGLGYRPLDYILNRPEIPTSYTPKLDFSDARNSMYLL